ncbi:hypothetical protein [Paraburkholderia sp. J12]|uniref:hypothetical protein n=1 Tax=Paraburkholderia sp. J12 TaxID=2805432 RepID=UPI002ABE62A9|nr:hypothetical protein [Paraburkholderia sp. J12]
MMGEIEQDMYGQPKCASAGGRRAAAGRNTKTPPAGESPYTVKNLDGAIAHLEVAIAVDDNIAVFGRRYWLDRVQQIALTPGIMQNQARRLKQLHEQLMGNR